VAGLRERSAPEANWTTRLKNLRTQDRAQTTKSRSQTKPDGRQDRDVEGLWVRRYETGAGRVSRGDGMLERNPAGGGMFRKEGAGGNCSMQEKRTHGIL